MYESIRVPPPPPTGRSLIRGRGTPILYIQLSTQKSDIVAREHHRRRQACRSKQSDQCL